MLSDQYGFVARPFAGNNFVGACGDVHHPPNITDSHEYDYSNPATVQSICKDWSQDGSAVISEFNCMAWGCSATGFHIWWMQNIPGYQNTNRDRDGNFMPNWWEYLFGRPDKTYTPFVLK